MFGLIFAKAGLWLAKPFVKYLLIALAVVAVIGAGVLWWKNHEASLIEEGRQIGRKEITMEYQAIVRENDRVNRKVEEKVDSALTKFTSRLSQTLDKVRVDSAKIAGDVASQIDRNPQVFKNPVCDTPTETIDARNAIRRLGPTPSKTPLPTE